MDKRTDPLAELRDLQSDSLPASFLDQQRRNYGL